MSLSSGYHEDDTGLPGALTATDFANGADRTDTTHPDDFADIDDYYIKLLPEIFFLEDSLFKLDLSFRERESLFFSSFAPGATFEGNTDIETVIASPQLIFKEQLIGFDNNLTLGFDFINAEEDIVNTATGFPTREFTLEKENYGYYIHDEFYPLEILALSVGYRHDRVEYTFEPSTPSKTDFDEDLFTGGINYNFYKDSYVYFSYSDSFRYPVLDELFNFQSNTIDPSLVPQTSDDYELGVRHHFTKSLNAGINLFRIDTENEIFFNPAGGPFGFGANENLDGETRREGVEIAVGKTFKNVTLRGSYTYTDAEIKSGQFSGNDVPSVPEHKATFDAVFYPIEGFTIAINGIYIGERFFESDFANAVPKQDDYAVLNAKFKYDWKNYTAFLDINNIFDKEYSEYGVLSSFPIKDEPAFYPSPEINFLLGVSAAF
jgi:iron complex outermembrane receptor protein